MNSLRQWLQENLLMLNLTDTMENSNGFTRLGFTKEEKAAHARFREIAESLGLKTWQDEIGNQWALWEVNPDLPTIGMGSHLDTVVEGGGYDGVAGILCSLGAVRELKRNNFSPEKNIAIVCFISEESARFGVSTIGSKTIIGEIDKEKWQNITDSKGISIRQAVEDYGSNWNEIENAVCRDERFESFIELHIEQGTQLYKQQKDIGIVRRISTPIRLQTTAYGMSSHTGTTMMEERKDALVAISPIITFVNEKAIEFNKSSDRPLVATVSTVHMQPNVMNVIPGEVQFGIDIRSSDDQLKEKFASMVIEECKKLGTQHDIEVEVKEIVNEKSVILDQTVQSILSAICDDLSISYIHMNSGAGHDVMNIAKKWPAGLLFMPSVDGISHHPGEFTPVNNLEIGVEVLKAYIERESRGGCGR